MNRETASGRTGTARRGPASGHGRRTALVALAAVILGGTAAARAAEPTLYTVVSAKDEIVVGIATDDAPALRDVGAFARKLKADGQMTVWRYQVGRNAAGALELRPAGRIAILAHDSVRIEPYKASLPVAPIDDKS
jgi:hypothetical protein